MSAAGGDACPYQGLAPFETARSDVFFGRTRAVRDLLARLAPRLDGQGAVLLVSGASGVGKSSLLRAGLLPALADGDLPVAGSRNWPRLLLTPTTRPLRALAAAWAAAYGEDTVAVERRLRDEPYGIRPATRPVLVVDQFEELFTPVTGEPDRQAFAAALHALATGPAAAAVVLGVRSDHWDRCAAYPQFAEGIQDGQVIVEPMMEPDLRLVITGPAAAAGLEPEPGLVETILADLRAGGGYGGYGRYGAGALPLLSQALRNTWERREGGRLTVRGYEESGGVRDSVRRTADAVLDGLPSGERTTALRLVRRLTLITAGGRVVRRTATRAELYAAASAHSTEDRDRVDALLTAFAARRLLILHEESAEIAHDALLTAWPALRRWLGPELSAQAVYDRLVADAGEWAEHHRDPAFLYRGARLLAVDDSRPRWARDPDSFPPPGPTVEGFVAASAGAARRAGRRRALVMAGLATLAVAALVAAGAAVRAAGDADHQHLLAVSRQLAAQSEIAGDPATAALLAVAAWRTAPTPEARYRMLVAATRPGRGTLAGRAGAVQAVAFSGDGRRIAAGGAGGTVRVWDVASRRRLGAPIVPPRRECPAALGTNAVALSPDGRTLAASCGGSLRFWSVATHRALGAPVPVRYAVTAIAYSPDGRDVAVADTGTVRILDAATHRPRRTLTGHPDARPGDPRAVRAMAFSSNGRVLATGSAAGAVRFWDATTYRRAGPPVRTPSGVRDLAVSADARTVATAGPDGAARVWDADTRKQAGEPVRENAAFDAVALSPDGTRLVTGGPLDPAVLWDVSGHRRATALTELSAHGVPVRHVAFSPDGTRVAAVRADGVVQLSDPRRHQQIGGVLPAQGTGALSPDGRLLATSGRPGDAPAVRLWDAAGRRPSGPPLEPAGARGAVPVLRFVRGGRTLVASGPGGLRIFDVARRRALAREPGLTGPAVPAPDGRFVAVQEGGAILFWDVARRHETGPRIRVPGYTDAVTVLALSPDGTRLATAGPDRPVRIFDVAARRPVGGPLPLTVMRSFLNDLEFSPDGRRLALTAADSSVRLWDVARRRPVGAALTAGRGAFTALAFGPRGATLATGSTDDDVRLWDLRTYRQIGAPMAGHGGDITEIGYTRNGRTVATVSGDGTARLWDAAPPADPVTAACAAAGRSLTRAEWDRFAPGETYRRACPVTS